MPATPASSTSRRASSTPARSPGRCPGRSLTVTGRPLPSRRRAGDRDRLVGVVEQRRARAGLADLAHRAAHVQVDQVGARVGHDLRGLAHHVGVVAEELHRDRVLVRVDAQELAHGALVAVLEAEARHHLGHHQARRRGGAPAGARTSCRCRRAAPAPAGWAARGRRAASCRSARASGAAAPAAASAAAARAAAAIGAAAAVRATEPGAAAARAVRSRPRRRRSRRRHDRWSHLRRGASCPLSVATTPPALAAAGQISGS